MTIRPINGAKPTPGDCYALAVALKSFGFHAHVRTEETDDGYRAILSWVVDKLQEEKAKGAFVPKAPAPAGAGTGAIGEADRRARDDMERMRRMMKEGKL